MPQLRSLSQIFVWLLLALGLVACGGEVTTAVSGATPNPTSLPAPTVDTAAIADLVLAQLATAEASATAVPATAVSDTAPLTPILNTTLSTTTDLQTALVALYQQASPAVVYIIVPNVGSGSGFVYNAAGYIVTNNHVISGGNNYEVVFADGNRERATLVGSDVDSDLAVLKVESLPASVTPLPLAETDSLAVGQFVVAIGNPFGEQGSMSLGIISALGRSLESQRSVGSSGTYSLPEVIQTDAPINPGNSGGPLLNLEGAVVGINSAIASTTGTNSGVGFSIPVQAIRQIVPSLIAEGRYRYPYMGASFDPEISLEDESLYGLSQTQGAYVVTVTPGGPAAQAGLIPANLNTGRGGDLVIAIDGRAVTNFADMNSYLVFHTTVGQTVDLTILRDGQEILLPLTLGERP